MPALQEIELLHPGCARDRGPSACVPQPDGLGPPRDRGADGIAPDPPDGRGARCAEGAIEAFVEDGIDGRRLDVLSHAPVLSLRAATEKALRFEVIFFLT